MTEHGLKHVEAAKLLRPLEHKTALGPGRRDPSIRRAGNESLRVCHRLICELSNSSTGP
jgi:hypothetical protein